MMDVESVLEGMSNQVEITLFWLMESFVRLCELSIETCLLLQLHELSTFRILKGLSVVDQQVVCLMTCENFFYRE